LPSDPSRTTAAVSVCVSTYGRADRLDRLLAALVDQDLEGGLEVVVYDDASPDRTPQVLAGYREVLRLTVLRGATNQGPAVGRNAAWRAATSELVLFTDDDCQPSRGWAREHLAAAGPDRVTVGRTVPDPEQPEGPFSRTLRAEDARYFQTANIAYPARLLAQLGGFDERYRKAAGEDTDLGLRATERGVEVVFVRDALVLHDVRPSHWRSALRETGKWVDVPLFAGEHPTSAGTVLHTRLWWRASHPLALLALAGLVVSRRNPLALAAVVPWVRFRTHEQIKARRRHWPRVLAGQLLIDLAEVAVLGRGSLRHRHLLL
jgi:glycosyltransferase involved in cell wall biosynthesis